jgi:pimeloyl-ACP methyl ester carboxylesterase
LHSVLTTLLNSRLFFPARTLTSVPRQAGLIYEDMAIDTADAERLHGWWIASRGGQPALRGRAASALLVIHGDRDEIVPLMHGEQLYAAAPGPKQFEVLDGVGHNDLVSRAGEAWAAAVAGFCAGVP